MRNIPLLMIASSALIISNVACVAGTSSATTTVTAKVTDHGSIVPPVPSADADFFTPSQVKKIEQIAHDYIVHHPQVMVEAAQELQKEATADQQKHIDKVKSIVPQHAKEIFASKTPGRELMGVAKPKVIMAMFYSYQCPNCRAMESVFERILQTNKDLQMILIPWTFEGEADIYAAKATLAAQKQGKFSELHRALMSAPDSLTKEKIDKAAQDLGLNLDKLHTDMEDKTIENGIKANFKLAEDLKLIGTPTMFVANDQLNKFSLIPGRATEVEVQKAIDEVR